MLASMWLWPVSPVGIPRRDLPLLNTGSCLLEIAISRKRHSPRFQTDCFCWILIIGSIDTFSASWVYQLDCWVKQFNSTLPSCTYCQRDCTYPWLPYDLSRLCVCWHKHGLALYQSNVAEISSLVPSMTLISYVAWHWAWDRYERYVCDVIESGLPEIHLILRRKHVLLLSGIGMSWLNHIGITKWSLS